MTGLPQAESIDPELTEFVYRQGLAPRESDLSWQPLTGGVSSEILKLNTPKGSICIKRALKKLKVEADWEAPLSRNTYEWEWMKFAGQHSPENVPELLANDPELGVFAMEFLSPEDHPVWKSHLMSGHIDIDVARQVGAVLVRLHSASANSPELKARFDTYANFYDLRLEPYLLATADKHPDLKHALTALSEKTGSISKALVHGDVSPKNILIGSKGPLLLDAECAWYGDPAFDLAFCLNHLLLKCLVNIAQADEYIEAYSVLADSYMNGCDWEPRSGIEGRTSALLPALLLARVDGKSPVEYITDDVEKDLIRAVAKSLLINPVHSLSEVAEIWKEKIY